VRAALVAVLVLAPVAFAQSAFDLQGYVAARTADVDSERFERDDVNGVAQLGLEWRPSQHFDLHVSGAAYDGDSGLVEAYVDGRLIFGLDELQLRAGQFFLPASRENRGELWTSPYSINFSALNTWIAEEFRPIGLDLEWRHTSRRGHIVTAAATAFRGNDSMGALLGWRGWAIGNRLSTYGELRPLPELSPLFDSQRDDGTKPFGRDLDGNTGYSARVRYAVPQRGSVQYAYVDNRGDRRLYRGEYAWATDFHVIGGEIGDPDDFLVAAEFMHGSTGMGFAPAFVQADFDAAYALVSDKRGRNRWTARIDLFGVDEKDFSAGGNNDENGLAWTLAWLFDVTNAIRVGAELTQVSGDNFAGAETDGRSFTVEARYTF
jgi:hypothetical protein